jgi:hypothetical protein
MGVFLGLLDLQLKQFDIGGPEKIKVLTFWTDHCFKVILLFGLIATVKN